MTDLQTFEGRINVVKVKFPSETGSLVLSIGRREMLSH